MDFPGRIDLKLYFNFEILKDFPNFRQYFKFKTILILAYYYSFFIYRVLFQS